MPIAYQEQVQLTCPACGAEFAVPVWLVLDAQEEPGAVELLRRGELNWVACPSCGADGPAGAPLLFHDGQARRVIFAPAPGSAEHELRDQARELHALLVGSIPEEQRRPYLADVDIAQDLDGVAHLLKRMDARRRQGDRGTRGQGEARQLAEPSGPPSPRPPVPLSSSDQPPLLVAVEAMLAADTPDELDAALAAHPVLLDPATDATLAQLIDVAVEQRAFEVADSLRSARAILGQVGAVGAGASATAGTRGTARSAIAALSEAALQALLQAQSGEELLVAADMHPALLRPEADAELAERVNLALDDGNERLARALEERREALAELRVAVAQSVPAEEQNDAPTLDEAIEALLVAEGEDAIAAVIDQYPVLLDDVAARALWQFAAEARASGDEELARYAVECREMLQRVREELGQ